MATAKPDLWKTIKEQREKIGKQLSSAKAEASASFKKYVSDERSVLPQAEQDKLNARDEKIKNAHAKLTEHATNFTNAVKGHITTAAEKIKSISTNGLSAATLTASHDATQSAISKIEELCSKYQKKARPGSVAAELRKTAGRRKNGKKTLRKRR